MPDKTFTISATVHLKPCDEASEESEPYLSREAHTKSFLRRLCDSHVLFQEHEGAYGLGESVTTGHAGAT